MPNSRSKSWSTIIATFFLLLVGCSTQVEQYETALPTSTITPLPSTTATPLPLFTDVPIPTATPFPTISASPTWTPAPTLTFEEREVFLQEMVLTSDDCKLPCLWGIVPGETTWQKMLLLFNERGIELRQGRVDGHSKYALFDPSSRQYTKVELLEQDVLVKSLRVLSYGDVRTVPSAWDDFWEHFEMQDVLLRFGVPSQVYLSSYSGSHGDHHYDLWIEYKDLGIIVRYSGTAIWDATGYYVCPVSADLDLIELWLQAPGSTLMDSKAVGSEIKSDGYKSEVAEVLVSPGQYAGGVVDLTQMTIQEFYDVFMHLDHQTCLRTDSWHDYEFLMPSDSQKLSSLEKEDAFLTEMLTTNGNCELPCWWGITPGITSLEDAKQEFLSLGKGMTYEWLHSKNRYMVDLFGRHTPYPFDYVVRHTLYEQDDVISLIQVTGHTLGWSLPQHFAQDWHRYSLDQVLARLGPPSRVLMQYYPYVGSSYNISVLYDDLGVMIEYGGLVEGESEELQSQSGTSLICPRAEQMTTIRLSLVAPDTGYNLEDEFYDSSLIVVATLEEATGIELHTFYETYLAPDTQVCLEAANEFGSSYP